MNTVPFLQSTELMVSKTKKAIKHDRLD